MGRKDKALSFISIIVILITVSIAIVINFFPNPYKKKGSDISILLSKGWQYYKDNSGLYNTGNVNLLPIGIENADWIDVNSKDLPFDVLDGDTSHPNKWVRVKLPNLSINDPMVFFTTCGYNFNLYYNNKAIYNFGDMTPDYKRKIGIFRHSIKISDYEAGKYVYFEVHSCFSFPYGINGIFGSVELNSSNGYVTEALSERDNNIKFFGFSFIFIGIISMLVFMLTKMTEKMAFSFGLFAFCAGLFMISYNQTVYSFYIHPFFLYYMLFLSYYLLPVGACLFIKNTFEVGFKKVYNIIIFAFLAHAIIMLVLDILKIVPISLTNTDFDYFFILVIIYNVVIIIRATIKGNLEACILTVAISMAAFLGIYDIWRALFNIVWQRHYRYNHQWGILFVVLALGFIITRRFVQSHESLKKYSKEIEKWSKLLEKRVDERTEELTSLNEELALKNEQLTTINAKLDNLNKEKELDNKKLKETLCKLEETQRQLVQSEKMVALGRLVAGIAHEINTPVGVGVTAVSYLEQKTEDITNAYSNEELTQEELEKYLELCKETSHIVLTDLQKASQLIRSFKQVAVDQSTEEKRDFIIKEYIEQILLSLKPKLKNTKHNINIDCEEDLHIMSYPGAFSQVLTNLIMNSLIHAFDNERKGNININVSSYGERIVLKYSDDGKGIPENYLNRIFDPFFTTKLGSGGTGLGLNIVYNIITQTFAGSIRCESEVNKGTTFIIEFSF